jgi:HD-like signal output (HDOD) protein
MPPLPTLLATRLQLQLLLSEHAVDLTAVTSVILNDLGATLELFRRAGSELGPGEAAPGRLDDCLASLPTEAWLEVTSAQALERYAASDRQLTELTSFWEHGRLLAYACWLVAQRTEGICPEDAYLFGLLHELLRLPALLGWPVDLLSGQTAEHATTLADRLAAHWHLPDGLRAALVAPSACTRWSRLLETAHAWARGEDSLLPHTA